MNIAYFVSNGKYNQDIEKIKNYYLKENPANNFFISYSRLIDQSGLTETACINVYYTRFMEGKIVFDNLTDYQKQKHMSAKPVLFTNNETFETLSDQERSEFDEILTLQNNTIKRIYKNDK